MSDNFRTQVAEEASSRYPQTSQDVEFNAFTQGASWAFATHATAAGIREAVKAELDACCEWLRTSDPGCAHPEWRRERATRLYLARRVVPAALKAELEEPTMAEEALVALERIQHGDASHGSDDFDLVANALGQLRRWDTPTTPPTPELGEVRRLVAWLNMIAQHLVDKNLSGAPPCRRAAILLEQQESELAALRGERFVAGQNRINQLWVDALDPSTQVPLSASQIKKLRKVLADHCDQGPPNGTMWKSQELEELMWAVEGWVSAATPQPAPHAGEGRP